MLFLRIKYFLCNFASSKSENQQLDNDQMDKQELKKQILHRLIELKAEDQMNRFVFTQLARENSKDQRIDEVLDFANDIKKKWKGSMHSLKNLINKPALSR